MIESLRYTHLVPRLPKLTPKKDLRPEPEAPQNAAEQALAIVAPTYLDEDGHAAAWLPQPGEDAQSYAAFSLWLESGADVPPVQIAKNWAWVERRAAYKAWGATGIVPSESMRKDASLRACTMFKQTLALEGAKLLAAAASNSHPTMSVRECTKALKDVVTLERLLDGLSTENVSLHLTEADPFAGLTEDEQETLLRIEMARRARLEKGA